MKKIITNSENETRDLAKKIANDFTGGEVIGLIGDLGAGKTAFTKGLAERLGIKKNITSPTFVFMKVYDAPRNTKIKKFVHIDAYRINSVADIEAIGAPEYFDRADTITIIEWANNIKNILPKKCRYIKFKNLTEDKREISF